MGSPALSWSVGLQIEGGTVIRYQSSNFDDRFFMRSPIAFLTCV